MKKKRVCVLGEGGARVVCFLRRNGFDAFFGIPSEKQRADLLLCLPSVDAETGRRAAAAFPNACVLTAGTAFEGAVCAKGLRTSAALVPLLTACAELHGKLRAAEEENARLNRALGELKLIDRAKCALVRHCGMSEGEAHRYLEKTAMDSRLPRRAVAESILEKYRD